MKSVQNSLDSSKNSATSAQDAGNKVIKNVAQGIQNTSWMFDKFSNLLDELASAFDEMPAAEPVAKKQVDNSKDDSSAKAQEDDRDQANNDDASVGSTSSPLIDYAQLNFVALQHAAHHGAQRAPKSTKSNQSDNDDANATEGSSQEDEVSAETVAAVVLGDNSSKSAAGVAVQSKSEKPDEQVADDDDASSEHAPDEQTQQFLAQQAQKGDVTNGEQHSGPDKDLKLQDQLEESASNIQNPSSSVDKPKVEADKQHDLSSNEIGAVASKSSVKSSSDDDDRGALNTLSNSNKQSSTDSLQASQAVAQSAAQQNQASSSSFQSAVKSAQSAVSQTVESVKEMIKELSNVSNASAAAKALGQSTVSLATQIRTEKTDTQASKNSPPLTRTQILRTLERVENTLKEIVKSRDGKSISLRLDPPNLGSLKIDISFKEGNLHARIVPESSQVALALRERAHELQSILRRVGIDAMQVSVTIASPSSSGQEVPHHAGNLFLGDSAQSEGDGSSEGSDSTPKEPHKGFKDGKEDVLHQAGGSELDHWVA